MESKEVKYWLYVKAGDKEHFLNDKEDYAPNWSLIDELGDKKPWLFNTPQEAHIALMCLVNIPYTNIAEIRVWEGHHD